MSQEPLLEDFARSLQGDFIKSFIQSLKPLLEGFANLLKLSGLPKVSTRGVLSETP